MDQMLGTALLLLIISAVTDSRNMRVNSSLVPLLIGLGLTAIHIRLVSSISKLLLVQGTGSTLPWSLSLYWTQAHINSHQVSVPSHHLISDSHQGTWGSTVSWFLSLSVCAPFTNSRPLWSTLIWSLVDFSCGLNAGTAISPACDLARWALSLAISLFG